MSHKIDHFAMVSITTMATNQSSTAQYIKYLGNITIELNIQIQHSV